MKKFRYDKSEKEYGEELQYPLLCLNATNKINDRKNTRITSRNTRFLKIQIWYNFRAMRFIFYSSETTYSYIIK